ncbi:MAG: hypothetical protein IBJ10_03965 [Phycisphaerales bacterium]|nr:hypothetical protein [Phycisphaerales bacterium]
MTQSITWLPLVAAIIILGALALATEVGYRFGRRAVRHHEAPASGPVGAIQGAMLGLLGLLLGFSFAGAAGRFMERQDLIIREANAIGTAYLRADLLDEPHAAHLRTSLAEYVRHRIAVSRTLHRGLSAETEAQIQAHHAAIWSAARDGALAKPAALVAVLGPVNETIDLHALRIAAGRKHLPALVLGLLAGCSLLAMAVIGYGCGLSGRRSRPMTWSLSFLVGAALWTTLDLDYPRIGLVRLSDAPLHQLRLD